MSLFIKICGLRSADDVAAAVDAGADAVGFVFAKSVRRVTPDEAAEATLAVPKNVKRVAVMRHPTNEEWRHVLVDFVPDVLQTDIEDYLDLDVPDSITCWPVIREGHEALNKPLPHIFLYEGAKSGSGEIVDWERAAAIAEHSRMILAGGLSAENLEQAITEVRPYGVDVSSAVESAPGIKDPELIHRFVQAARAAESTP